MRYFYCELSRIISTSMYVVLKSILLFNKNYNIILYNIILISIYRLMWCFRHNDDEQFWSNATVEDWAKEMAGMRIITEKYANLTDNSVVGLRSPYLRVGGNNQFTMMEEQAFLYDSSITAPLSNPPLWPYTMYFRMPHRWVKFYNMILVVTLNQEI